MNQNESTAKTLGGPEASDDLRRLQRGEITMDEYLECRLELQIKELGLDRLLTDEKRDMLRAIMREHFFDDPVLQHYAQRAASSSSND